MSYEQVWIAIFVPALLAAAALAVWARHLRESKRVAEREMIHRERMAALEKGLALPELPAGLRAPGELSGNGRAWVSQAALLAGLTLLFGGIGLFLAFFIIPDTPETAGMQAIAPVGLMPAFAGVGLLLFYVLDRRARRHAEE
ncbi:MAG TPA: DUF6249 domain-containing protein [Thermoanaerobaculia bacterium]